MSTQKAQNDVVEIIEAQMEKLYETETNLNISTDFDELEGGERPQWSYFLDNTESEQEIIEQNFSSLYDGLLETTSERLNAIVSQLRVVFKDPPPPSLSETGEKNQPHDSRKKIKRTDSKFVIESKLKANAEVVCLEQEETKDSPAEYSNPKSKCDALMEELVAQRENVITSINTLLDNKFTLYRRSLDTNRAKNYEKLTTARLAVKLFKQKFEFESLANMKDRDRQVYKDLEERYQGTISSLEDDLNQYVASVNLKTQRNLSLLNELNEVKDALEKSKLKCDRIYDDLSNVSFSLFF
jgi:hypothetical protein